MPRWIDLEGSVSEAAVSSFDSLRPWRGEQSRAFEELSYQLLKDQVPTGVRAIRTGNPDGGVEWYAALPDGSEWGWQAKHVHGIDALLSAMTDSVKRVASDRPQLKRLTFVISSNLSTGRNRAERKTQREKYEDKILAWKRDIPRAGEIDFKLVQESELLAELSKPEHAGRRMFWWGGTVLGPDWLRQRHREQADAARDKYRPELQVDVPIQQDLLALGFDANIRADFQSRSDAILSAISDLRDPPEVDEEMSVLYTKVGVAVSELRAKLTGLYVAADTEAGNWEPIMAVAKSCQDLLYDAVLREHQTAESRKSETDRSRRDYPFWVEGPGGRELQQELSSLIDWLESPVGNTFQRHTYFLTGRAGSGKTHLFLDATQRAIAAGRPAVFLAGARFGQSSLWTSVTDQLGLPDIGADELLEAMDAAGEAAALVGSRFIIFVDALNETVPPEFWQTHLPSLRAAVAHYSHIALAVSCRDTYEPLVLEGSEADRYIRREHPGFADREVEATQRYFSHYRLEAPRIPLLTPEFTLPLFLRLYCESFQDSAPPQHVGHEGRVTIFSRYLEAKIRLVARRVRPGATSSYELDAACRDISAVLDSLLDAMAETGRDGLSLATAETIARANLPDATADARRVLGLLQEEGVVTREMIYLGDGASEDGMRIAFQAFSDFLLLKRRFGRSADPLHDEALKAWLKDECSWGIREAAFVYLPEVYGVELPDYIGENPTLGTGKDNPEAWRKQNGIRFFYQAFVETLPYRQASAITDRTIELLNVAQPFMPRTKFYRTLVTCAPQASNRLNGDGLHRYLCQRKMPERDADFGIAMYYELRDQYSPLSRLAHWAADGPYPTYDPEIVELAAIPLCWLLASPNRAMRDWITKALAQLLRGHLDVAIRLVERFWVIDDPYVVQRVIVIAYSALLRSVPGDLQAKPLVERITNLVFTPPVRADELLLDAARGVARWGVTHEFLIPSVAASAMRPYDLSLPGNPPTEANLKAKYGWREDQPDESYFGIWMSIFDMGDFGRYIVESTLDHFSRHRIGRPYPDRESQSKPRFIKARWEAFVSSLSDEQRGELADFVASGAAAIPSPLDWLRPAKYAVLTETQTRLLDRVLVYPKRVSDEYPSDQARRWVMNRVVTLGWTPQLFGQQDRMIGHGRMRRDNGVERWGKKYQWIAFHELLARVADNFQLNRNYANDDTEKFDELGQMIGDREIDPTLPPIDYRAFIEDETEKASGWRSPLIQLATWPPKPIDFTKYRADTRAFVSDHSSEPFPEELLFFRDANGNDWVALDGFYSQTDRSGTKWGPRLRQQAWCNSFFVSAGEGQRALTTLANGGEADPYLITASRGHIDCCCVAEVGRVGPTCGHRCDVMRTVVVGDSSFDAVETVENYTWEGNALDGSLKGDARLILPSGYLQQRLDLEFDVHGPSWLDSSGRPVLVYYDLVDGASRALLMRKSILREVLADHNLELLTLLFLERLKIASHFRQHEPKREWSVQGWLDGGFEFHSGIVRLKESNL